MGGKHCGSHPSLGYIGLGIRARAGVCPAILGSDVNLFKQPAPGASSSPFIDQTTSNPIQSNPIVLQARADVALRAGHTVCHLSVLQAARAA